jgi:hypothetical protein
MARSPVVAPVPLHRRRRRESRPCSPTLHFGPRREGGARGEIGRVARSQLHRCPHHGRVAAWNLVRPQCRVHRSPAR